MRVQGRRAALLEQLHAGDVSLAARSAAIHLGELKRDCVVVRIAAVKPCIKLPLAVLDALERDSFFLYAAYIPSARGGHHTVAGPS
jgi:hypothetical protein